MILIFGVLIGGNIYLARRFSDFFAIENVKWLYLLFGSISLYMFFGGFSTANAIGFFGHIVNITAFTLLGFVLYVLLSTLIVDLAGLIVAIPLKMKGMLSLGLAALISIYGILNARNTRITNVNIPVPGLEKEVRAMHLTDTHLGHFRGRNNLMKLVERINAENVDVVFFTGDLLDGRRELKAESMQPLQDLKAPIYFVEGNHDLYTGVKAIKNYLSSIGVNVLTNEVTEWNGIQIIGLNHMIADSAAYDMHADGSRLTVRKALETLEYDSQKPLVLLHHGPAGIKYAADAGVDLYLAGHTHGGQLFPATLVARAIFEYNKGLHRYQDTHVYVCEGTGTFGPPMRVGTKSGMAILTLKPE